MTLTNHFAGAALLVAAALAVAAPVAQAQTNGQTAPQIARLYRISDQAADAQDAAAPASMTDAGFVFIGPKGDRHDRAQVLSSLQANYAQMHTMGFHTQTATHVNSVRVTGDRADVRYSQHQILRHASRTLAIDATGEDQWVRTPAGWKLAQSRVLTARQDRPTTSLLSPQEMAALNTLIAVRNRAALQGMDDSVALFNQTLAIDQSINDASSQQIHDERQREKHREIYGY